MYIVNMGLERTNVELKYCESCGALWLRKFRAHTLKLLKHYLKLSLDYGRIPSVLGGEVTRARVSHTKLHTIEDETIFIHDMNCCLERELDNDELRLTALIVFMEHTFDEAAVMQGYSLRQTYRMFDELMDRLTRAFFESEFLDQEKLMRGKKKPMGRARVDVIQASAAIYLESGAIK